MVTPPPRRPRALVAEDDPDMRALVVEALRGEGMDVEEAEDGRRMWGLTLRLDGYDLIVTDYRLPIVDAVTVVEDLRARHLRTPVILMTAFGDEAVRARAGELGAVFLSKPFSMTELNAAARSLLGRAP
jgi:two-component system response regulator ResD